MQTEKRDPNWFLNLHCSYASVRLLSLSPTLCVSVCHRVADRKWRPLWDPVLLQSMLKKTSLIIKESQQFLSHSQGRRLPKEKPKCFGWFSPAATLTWLWRGCWKTTVVTHRLHQPKPKSLTGRPKSWAFDKNKAHCWSRDSSVKSGMDSHSAFTALTAGGLLQWRHCATASHSRRSDNGATWRLTWELPPGGAGLAF